jgi:hypothetical protein
MVFQNKKRTSYPSLAHGIVSLHNVHTGLAVLPSGYYSALYIIQE